MKKYIVIIATAALLLLVFAPAALAAPPAWGGWDNCGDTCYTVQPGDTLFSISRMYGVNPYRIAWANRLPNPDCIYEGQVLIIPSDDSGLEGGDWPHPGSGPYPGRSMVAPMPGDGLFPDVSDLGPRRPPGTAQPIYGALPIFVQTPPGTGQALRYMAANYSNYGYYGYGQGYYGIPMYGPIYCGYPRCGYCCRW